jgi:ATP-binding protein involved in chromosome partitioning
MLDKAKILKTLSQVNDPELHRSLTDLKMVRDVRIQDGKVEVTIALTIPNCPIKAQIESDVHAAIATLPGVKQVSIKLTSMTDEERKAILGDIKEGAAAPYNHVQCVVAVMSGKSGVGKSLSLAYWRPPLRARAFRWACWMQISQVPASPCYSGCKAPWNPVLLASGH